MKVLFWVVSQQNGRKVKPKFVGEKDVPFLVNNSYHNFKKSTYIVLEQTVDKTDDGYVVTAKCHKCKYIKDDTEKKNTTSGDPNFD